MKRCLNLLLAIGLCVAATSAWAADHTTDPLPVIKQRVAQKEAVLVDVREQKEWDRGHIEGAILLPLSEISKRSGQQDFVRWLTEQLPEGKPLYIHCASGGRCLLVSELLDKHGYQTKAMKPGYKQLIEAGFPPATE